MCVHWGQQSLSFICRYKLIKHQLKNNENNIPTDQPSGTVGQSDIMKYLYHSLVHENVFRMIQGQQKQKSKIKIK